MQEEVQEVVIKTTQAPALYLILMEEIVEVVVQEVMELPTMEQQELPTKAVVVEVAPAHLRQKLLVGQV
tara:strand:- start:2 stop:208 length:207 start_codon:yes stop_codon:yes gene_type:complete